MKDEINIIIKMIKIYGNTVIKNSFIDCLGEEKILDELKKYGFICKISTYTHFIENSLRIDTDYIVELL